MRVVALDNLSTTFISPMFIYRKILTISPKILAFITAPETSRNMAKIRSENVLGIKSFPVSTSTAL
jgi:hypothetical protein